MYMTINFTSFNRSRYSSSLLGKLGQRCAMFGVIHFCTNVDFVLAPYFSTYNNVFLHIIVRWVIEFLNSGIQK